MNQDEKNASSFIFLESKYGNLGVLIQKMMVGFFWCGCCKNFMNECRKVKLKIKRGGGNVNKERRYISRMSKQGKFCLLVHTDML